MGENIFMRDRKTPVLEDYLSYAAGSSRSPCSGAPGGGQARILQRPIRT